MNFVDRLIAGELQDSLGEGVIGRRIIVLASTRSTNDFLIQMLTPELTEGLVVFAEEQTAGRGQRGNRWVSAAHLGLWFSILLRPQLGLAESARLTQWASQAIGRTIEKEFGLIAMIKPPNDVFLDRRKIAGVRQKLRSHARLGVCASLRFRRTITKAQRATQGGFVLIYRREPSDA